MRSVAGKWERGRARMQTSLRKIASAYIESRRAGPRMWPKAWHRIKNKGEPTLWHKFGVSGVECPALTLTGHGLPLGKLRRFNVSLPFHKRQIRSEQPSLPVATIASLSHMMSDRCQGKAQDSTWHARPSRTRWRWPHTCPSRDARRAKEDTRPSGVKPSLLVAQACGQWQDGNDVGKGEQHSRHRGQRRRTHPEMITRND